MAAHLLLKGLVGRVALRCQLTGFHSRAHGAARLLVVGAVAEAARFGQGLHVGEGGTDARLGVPKPRPRTPGISTMRPAPGTSTISRLTVVWRPLPSPSRTAPTLKTSAPTSMFTRLDFPTPERPMSTVVVPGARSARTASTDAGSSSDTTSTSAAGAARAWHGLHGGPGGRVVGQIGLGEHDSHLGPRLEGQYQLALEAPQVHLAHGLGHDDPLEVGGEHLGHGALGGILAHELAGCAALWPR